MPTAPPQLPAALQLPLRPQQQQPQQQPSPPQHTADTLAASELDLDTLTAAVPSRLLVSLLAAAAGSEVAGPAAEVLSCLDGAAAAKNDYLALFKSQERFPQVRVQPSGFCGHACIHSETPVMLH